MFKRLCKNALIDEDLHSFIQKPKRKSVSNAKLLLIFIITTQSKYEG